MHSPVMPSTRAPREPPDWLKGNHSQQAVREVSDRGLVQLMNIAERNFVLTGQDGVYGFNGKDLACRREVRLFPYGTSCGHDLRFIPSDIWLQLQTALNDFRSSVCGVWS